MQKKEKWFSCQEKINFYFKETIDYQSTNNGDGIVGLVWDWKSALSFLPFIPPS